jgi:hypothetical protein
MSDMQERAERGRRPKDGANANSLAKSLSTEANYGQKEARSTQNSLLNLEQSFVGMDATGDYSEIAYVLGHPDAASPYITSSRLPHATAPADPERSHGGDEIPSPSPSPSSSHDPTAHLFNTTMSTSTPHKGAPASSSTTTTTQHFPFSRPVTPPSPYPLASSYLAKDSMMRRPTPSDSRQVCTYLAHLILQSLRSSS